MSTLNYIKQILPKQFSNLLLDGITKKKYIFSTTLTGEQINMALLTLCNQTTPQSISSKETRIMVVNSYNYDTCEFKKQYNLEETIGALPTININALNSCLIWTTYNNVELDEFIKKNANNKYIFIPIKINNSEKFNYTVDSVHIVMIILDNTDKKIYYFDPNGWRDIFNKAKTQSKYNRFTIDELFLSYLGRVLPTYEYVPVNVWLSQVNNDYLQNTVQEKEYDDGNCLTLVLMFAHCLSISQLDINTTRDLLASLQPVERQKLIYSYICGLFNLLQ